MGSSEPTGRRTFELLLACARTRMHAASIERVRSLAGMGVDWEAVVCQARRHRVSPLVYRGLRHCGAGIVPAEIAEELRADCHSVALRNLQLAEETAKLTSVLGDAGVRTLAFKGAPLSAMVYGDLTLRVTGDIDLLVSAADVDRAAGLLVRRGYEARAPRLTDGLERAGRGRGALLLFRQEGRFDLDLHWRLLAPHLGCELGIDELWQSHRVVPTEVGSIPAVAGDQLHLVLAVQLAKEFWRGEETLKYVCDVAEAMTHDDRVNWPSVLGQGRRLGCERILLFAQALAARALGVEASGEIYKAARRDRRVRELVEDAFGRLASALSRPRVGHERHAAHLAMRERQRDRLRYASYVLARWWRVEPSIPLGTETPSAPGLGRLWGRTRRWISLRGIRGALGNAARLMSRALR